MAEHGLDGFLYELVIDGDKGTFIFTDPEDVSNSSQVSVGKADIPETAQISSRETADLAYSKVSKELNEKRDARLVKKAQDELKDRQEVQARERAATTDFLANTEDTIVKPVSEDENSRVYNTANLSDDTKDDKKKK